MKRRGKESKKKEKNIKFVIDRGGYLMIEYNMR